MTKLRTLASYQGYSIVYGVDSCLYLITPDAWIPVETKQEAAQIAPEGIRLELAKQLRGNYDL